MRIGFDLDSTLLDFQLGVVKVMKAIYRQEGKEVTVLVDPCYDVEGIIEGLTREEGIRLKEQNLGWFCLEEEPIEGALEMLTELKRRGHELFVVTARNHEEVHRVMGFPLFDVQEFTKAQVNFWFPGIFTNIFHATDKTVICDELGLDILVDDYVPHLESLKGHSTIPVAVDWSYNREYSGLRVKKLKELIAIIDELEVTK